MIYIDNVHKYVVVGIVIIIIIIIIKHTILYVYK